MQGTILDTMQSTFPPRSAAFSCFNNAQNDRETLHSTYRMYATVMEELPAVGYEILVVTMFRL